MRWVARVGIVRRVTARTLLLTLHIIFVAGWLGANVVQMLLAPRFDKAGGAGNLEWSRAVHWFGQRYYPVVGVVVLLTGIGLVTLDSSPYEFGSGFVVVGIVVVILAAILGGAVFGPLAAKRVAALESGDTGTAKTLLSRIIGFGVFDTALVVLALLAMVDKWGV